MRKASYSWHISRKATLALESCNKIAIKVTLFLKFGKAMRTSNPVLQDSTFKNQRANVSSDQLMSVQGVIWKTFLMLTLVLMGALWTWNLYIKSGYDPLAVQPWLLGGAIAGFGLAIATTFKPTYAPITAPLYAACQGLFIGAISALLNQSFPGIAIQAATLTFGTLAAMLIAYEAKLIKVTDTFRMIIISATGGIALTYAISIILSFFSIQIPFIYGNGLFGILFSLAVIGIAAMNFVLDFDAIDRGARMGIPKYMEWYGAFALMVTMIWLYVEFLRLLSKLRSR